MRSLKDAVLLVLKCLLRASGLALMVCRFRFEFYGDNFTLFRLLLHGQSIVIGLSSAASSHCQDPSAKERVAL